MRIAPQIITLQLVKAFAKIDFEDVRALGLYLTGHWSCPVYKWQYRTHPSASYSSLLVVLPLRPTHVRRDPSGLPLLGSDRSAVG